MSLTLELLRTETDHEPLYWPFNAGNGLVSAVPHDCPPKAKKSGGNSDSNNADAVNNNINNNNSNASTLKGLSQHKRHSYYDCCVNVEVTALLEHWLGWDDKHHHCSTSSGDSTALTSSTTTTTTKMTNANKSLADRLVSHLMATDDDKIPTDEEEDEEENPLLWVRKFCSEVGCDVLKKQDTNGKTLLHHLLSGAVKRNLASTATILLEAGTPPLLSDANGDTPLHLIRNLLTSTSGSKMDEVCDLTQVLLHNNCANIDLPDAKGRTLLTYSVEAGDRSVPLTRLLVNLGAKTFSEDSSSKSAFEWFLRAQMRKMGSEVAIDEETFYVLSTAMMEEAGGRGLKFKSIIDRSMMSMGSSPEAHGPLFRKIRGLAAPYWLQPPQLRLLAARSIRRSLGPKRLSSKAVMTRLKVPRKLQRFVTLEEKIPHYSN